MNVHFPVAAVVRAIVKFELVGSSVPNVVIALGHSDGVLRPALHDPGALVLVAIPPHEAAGLEAVADQDDLLVKVGAFESAMSKEGNGFKEMTRKTSRFSLFSHALP